MSMQGFWRWVDNDFNHPRPLSLALFMGIAALPLFFAFLFNASEQVIEAARGVSVIGVLIVLAYYLFRASKNIGRSFRDFGKLMSDKKRDRRDG